MTKVDVANISLAVTFVGTVSVLGQATDNGVYYLTGSVFAAASWELFKFCVAVLALLLLRAKP